MIHSIRTLRFVIIYKISSLNTEYLNQIWELRNKLGRCKQHTPATFHFALAVKKEQSEKIVYLRKRIYEFIRRGPTTLKRARDGRSSIGYHYLKQARRAFSSLNQLLTIYHSTNPLSYRKKKKIVTASSYLNKPTS